MTSPLESRTSRQDRLTKYWGFHCSCSRCSGEPYETAQSDDRVAQVHRLWKELDDYTATSAATPQKAELLVLLYELEGVACRMHEAHYRAAIEWSGVGEAAQACKYARLCLHRGQALRGPDQPFAKSMRELIENPEGHWSWRFRMDVSKQN